MTQLVERDTPAKLNKYCKNLEVYQWTKTPPLSMPSFMNLKIDFIFGMLTHLLHQNVS
jgi:hypothetical protein